MSTEVTVRGATESDMATVGRLAAELVRVQHQGDPMRFIDVEDPEPGCRRWLTNELSSHDAILLVAERDGHVVAYMYARIEDRSWGKLLDRHAQIHDVYVAEDARRLGAARALTEEMVRRLDAAGIPITVTLTGVNDERARKLLAAFGFRPTMIEMGRPKGG